ncbi:scopoletin glucosyltransferase-like [Euphorbia lathyris]|uniref:scopoletin glucosyltransferase-like n=1 Tax=Euphorbia lathyris TaxID=212925 RepID=UPI0033138D76
MATQSKNLHIFLFPLMAQGHILPMLDIAKLFAARQVKSTIITTPANASRFTKSIQSSSSEITLKLIKFPLQNSDSLEPLENLDSVTGHENHGKFFADLSLLQQPLKEAIEELKPDGLVSDFFFPWTTDLAAEFRIPRLIFHGTSFFSMCCIANLGKFRPYKKVCSDTELFLLPEFPDLIRFSRLQIPDDLLQDQPSGFSKLLGWAEEVEERSFGMLVNSFYELESSYADYYRNNLGKKAWHIGPVSLCNRNVEQKAQRGISESIEEHDCIKWLDSKKPNSVLYICFGTVANFSDSQLRELALGLEASGQEFIWVVRRKKKEDEKQGSLSAVLSKEGDVSTSVGMTNSENWIHEGRKEKEDDEQGGSSRVQSKEGVVSAFSDMTSSENWIDDKQRGSFNVPSKGDVPKFSDVDSAASSIFHGDEKIDEIRKKKGDEEQRDSPGVFSEEEATSSSPVMTASDEYEKVIEGINEKGDNKQGGLPAILSKEGATSTSSAITTPEENWIPAGYEKRIEGNGLIIRGWAPQMLILDHESVGGFMTHCGWNSVLEGISVGLPMVTWPIFADQFFNEKLITDVLKIGVGVGAKKWVRLVGDYVESGKIEKAVKEVMVGEKGEEFRNKAKKIGEMARSVLECGGSSYNDLSALIEELKSYHA